MILIMHADSNSFFCNKITKKNFPRSFRSLEVKLHVYIWFFDRDRLLSLKDINI